MVCRTLGICRSSYWKGKNKRLRRYSKPEDGDILKEIEKVLKERQCGSSFWIGYEKPFGIQEINGSSCLVEMGVRTPIRKV